MSCVYVSQSVNSNKLTTLNREQIEQCRGNNVCVFLRINVTNKRKKTGKNI